MQSLLSEAKIINGCSLGRINTGKTDYLKNVTRRLDLTPDQAAQMASILNDFAKYYQTVLSDGKARILNILNDEQRRKFEKMLKERPPG